MTILWLCTCQTFPGPLYFCIPITTCLRYAYLSTVNGTALNCSRSSVCRVIVAACTAIDRATENVLDVYGMKVCLPTFGVACPPSFYIGGGLDSGVYPAFGYTRRICGFGDGGCESDDNNNNAMVRMCELLLVNRTSRSNCRSSCPETIPMAT
jgi:hypothetical protein